MKPVVEQEVLKRLAKTNLRGVMSSDLVCEIQALRQHIDNEKDQNERFYEECRLQYILDELERRTRLINNGVTSTNREIISTIKDKVDIVTVLDWYTDVFTYKSKWTFRCTLHGEDKNPSGVIYKDDNRFRCFACGAHSDIFDVVQLFERVELIDAIRKLAKFIGLEIKPFKKQPTDIDQRLRVVEDKLNNPPVGNNKYRYIYKGF